MKRSSTSGSFILATIMVPIPTVVVILRDSSVEVMKKMLWSMAKNYGCTKRPDGTVEFPDETTENVIRKKIDAIFCH